MAQPPKRKDERTIYSVGGKRETPPVEKTEKVAKPEVKTEAKPTVKKTVAKKKSSAKKSKTSTTSKKKK